MEFALPQKLSQHLVSYDPALKKEIKLQRAKNKSTTKKPATHPLGDISNLFPVDVVGNDTFSRDVAYINGEAASHRYRRYSRVDNGQEVTYAILYHYQKVWTAVWLAPETKKGEYIFGFAHAVRDAARNKEAIECVKQNTGVEPSEMLVKRSKFLVFTQNVTKDVIVNKYDYNRRHSQNHTPWRSKTHFSYKVGQNISRLCVSFENSLKQTIPVWRNSYSHTYFERLVDTASFKNLLDLNHVFESLKDYIEVAEDWVPSFDNYVSIVKSVSQRLKAAGIVEYGYRVSGSLCHYQTASALPVLEKPFFRKWIQERCDQVVERIKDTDNDLKSFVTEPWEQIQKLAANICAIQHIWPNCPIDYYQTHVDLLSEMERINQGRQVSTTWLNENMPVASFFRYLEKHKETTNPGSWQRRRFTMWEDTVTMLGRLLIEKPEAVTVPKRWRLEEFHDHVQSEAWKLANKDEYLPQDLFPAPIKIQANDTSWTFFQPNSVHQLASWGQAVRNCVGNSTHYADGVKNKKHFIVLALIEGKPKFTVQLEVNNAIMSVRQIVGLQNSSLTPDEKSQYTFMFGKALAKRNEEVAAI